MTVQRTDTAQIFLFDTFSGERRELQLLEPGRCQIYCCGPTVYDHSHIGHARAALVPDVIVRFLRQQGIQVRYVRNITDIDDKIIARSLEEGIPAHEVAQKYADEYHRDLEQLGVLAPDVEPKVSEHIPQIVTLIEQLIDKDLAYVVDGDVYYRVKSFPAYGQLSKRSIAEIEEGAGARVEIDERKESPLDFALWKTAKPTEPSWSSPWGEGRPGWHIECSAMSSTHLGETFDIHAGGRDLIFPHHENEIAQSQGANGPETFARHWVHNGFINFAGEKMSKSLGNFFTIGEVLALYSGEAVRYFLLTVHYRHGLNFEVLVPCPACGQALDRAQQESERCDACGEATTASELKQGINFPGLEDADERVAYVYTTLQAVHRFLAEAQAPDGDGPVSDVVAELLPAFTAAMRQDFNTPAALGALSKPLGEVNRLLTARKGIDKARRYRTIDRFAADMKQVAAILGCFDQEPDSYLIIRRDQKARRIGLDIAWVEDLLTRRVAARGAKDWAAADGIRDELDALGVTVQDGADGSVWTL